MFERLAHVKGQRDLLEDRLNIDDLGMPIWTMLVGQLVAFVSNQGMPSFLVHPDSP